jgi:hypothetical protein
MHPIRETKVDLPQGGKLQIIEHYSPIETYVFQNLTIVHKVSGLCLTGPDNNQDNEIQVDGCSKYSPKQQWILEEHPWK